MRRPTGAIGTCSLALSVALSLAACATPAPTPPRDARDPADAEGTSTSLFPSDAAVLSDEQISDILDADARLRSSLRVALIHLEHRSALRFYGYGPYWTAIDPGTRQTLATELSKALTTTPRIAAARSLPTFLLPEKPSVGHLREAAARFRADAVVVYRSDCQAYERSRFLRSTQVKAFCNVETVLLDVRTGLVPISTAVLQQFTVDKQSEDAGFEETIRRAETETLRQALAASGAQITAALAGKGAAPN